MNRILQVSVLLYVVCSTFGCKAQSQQQNDKEISAAVQATKEANEALTAYQSNALGDKLITTESGIKYTIHQQGTGAKAKPGQYVLLHYYGMLMDGMRFDDSYKNGYPFGFLLGHSQVIEGFDEALLLLPEGSRFTVFIPARLAYGENGAPPVIPSNADLVFHISFIKIESQD